MILASLKEGRPTFHLPLVPLTGVARPHQPSSVTSIPTSIRLSCLCTHTLKHTVLDLHWHCGRTSRPLSEPPNRTVTGTWDSGTSFRARGH